MKPNSRNSVIIANGTALSGEIDLGEYTLAAIGMPAVWTTANLSFQAASSSGGTYQDVFDDTGSEVVVTAAHGHVIPINNNALNLAPLRFIKIRSGVTATPVNQGADRTLTLILKR